MMCIQRSSNFQLIELVYLLPNCSNFMVEKKGSKEDEPRRYFSTLYYSNQESRTSLPTVDEQAELAKLTTDYEGTRYQVPAGMHDVRDARKLFKEIDEDYDANAANKDDIRWNREHSLDNKNSDYDYRFWLQYQSEEISAGNRSMQLMKSRSKEFRDAMSKLSDLTVEVAENLYSMSYDVVNTDSKTSKLHPLAHLIELNRLMLKESNTTTKGLGEIILQRTKTWSYVMDINFSFEKDNGGKNLEYLKEKPLFYHLANTMLQVYFKSIRKSTKLRTFKNNDELIEALNELGYEDTEGKAKKELKQELKEQLLITSDKDLTNKNYKITYVCETNSFFRKLHKKIGKVLSKWTGYYTILPGKKDPFFEQLKHVLDYPVNEFLTVDFITPALEKFRRTCIKTAASCLFSAQLAGYINFDSASVDELDSLYDSEYEGSNTSYPNVVRMSKKLLNDLNQGDHAIIRHFQMDRKRNMYCLPKSHVRQSDEERQSSAKSSKGNGGFLHNDSMTVSIHPALTNLIEEGSLTHTRFEPSEDTINALNILQKTQWSINLDFLDFIAYFTYEGEKITPYPEDIRQVAWQRSDNMMLRDIFIERMGLRSSDTSMESRFRDIKFILKQARKNLLNAGNIFWHPWFCDWRGRFNTKVNELSPQGDDLSKAMLLFAKWKPLGERGRYWLYVRAYELLRKIPKINDGFPKLDAFDRQVEWVEERLDKIIKYGKKLNRKTSEIELEKLLQDLKVDKPKPKSEIFQRIAFLIEFVRIHEVYDKEKDWDKVKSGLPIHLDASCNGFQHIAALTRLTRNEELAEDELEKKEELAKEVNLLNKSTLAKGDLYKEVAVIAKNNLDEDFVEAKQIKKLIDDLELNENSRNALEEKIFSREFCKPLVILAGYGARDLHSTIMNFNGKKLRGGRYKPKKGSKSEVTLHLESELYQVIEELAKEYPGEFDKLVLKKQNEDKEYLIPVENCKLAHRFGLDLSHYIHKCIVKATHNTLGEIKEKLKEIYSNIDTLGIKTETDLQQLDAMTHKGLGKLLQSNNKPFSKLNKAERLDSVKELVIEKWKNKLYFSWQANETSSIVRYIKWKLENERGMAKLPTAILPKDYIDPGPEEIQNFIINSPDLSPGLLKELLEAQEKVHESRKEKKSSLKSNPQSWQERKLTSRVFMCLRNIILRTKDDEHREIAKNHYYARFIDLPKGRIKEGIKQGNLYSIDTSYSMKFKTDKKGLKEAVNKLRDLSSDIVLGMLPNYIHSFDALHMQNVVLELDKKGIQDIWAVHDSFGVHACDIEYLRDIVRETFVEIHQDPIQVHLKRIVELNRSILEPKFVDKYIVKIDKEIEEINRSPNNDWINNVLHSNYLIS